VSLPPATLMLAIRAVDSEIARRQRELRHAELTDEGAEDQSEYVLDLQKALSELGGAYSRARGDDPNLPDIDVLLGKAAAQDSRS
jgi:hypothetical protein